LIDSKISIRRTKLTTEIKNLKERIKSSKTNKSSRKDSKSTRRPSESSEQISEEETNEGLDKDLKISKILEEMYMACEQSIEVQKDAILDLLNLKENKALFEKGICTTFSTNKAFSDLLKQFMREASAVHKCPHCNAVQPSLRKEGYAKFILGGLSEKTKIGKVLFSGDGGDSESERSNLNKSEDE
jgi:hypothetical protein